MMHPSDPSLTSILAMASTERQAALTRAFPDAERAAGGGQPAARGGRAAALERLDAIDPEAYARSRNDVGGAVTRLSPWIRHGVLSLAEVRDAALARVRDPADAVKLISELGWRDYWRQVHHAIGDAIRADLEAPARRPRRPSIDQLPDDVRDGRTGMACIDAFSRRLQETGWLHNHERMWLASWLVHTRGVAWRAGADWFLRHLLDGDPASNDLSWQWIAGTFSSKPYLFNRENLERFTGGAHCPTCPVRGACDVEGGYEALDARLFEPASMTERRPRLRIEPAPLAPTGPTPSRPLVWLTLDSVSATSPAAAAFPEAPRVFVIDSAWLRRERPSLHRLVFVFECLADIPGVEVLQGDPREILPTQAAALGCDGVALTATPCPLVRSATAAMAGTLPIHVVAEPAFCDRSRVSDLGRFSRYWEAVVASAVSPSSGLGR